MDKTLKKSKTAEQGLHSLMRLCARREYCTSDARRLLSRWGVEPKEHNTIIARLTSERFIDDARYTEAYVREKLKFSNWGRRKIATALRAKHIDREIIDRVLDQYAPDEYHDNRLTTALGRKLKSVKYKDQYDLRGKLLRYGAGLGYDFDTVAECIDKLLTEYDQQD